MFGIITDFFKPKKKETKKPLKKETKACSYTKHKNTRAAHDYDMVFAEQQIRNDTALDAMIDDFASTHKSNRVEAHTERQTHVSDAYSYSTNHSNHHSHDDHCTRGYSHDTPSHSHHDCNSSSDSFTSSFSD